LDNRLGTWLACSVALACVGEANAGSWFAGARGAEIRQPSQCAMLHFQDGREILVLETRYVGPPDATTWIVALPSRPEVSVLRPEVSPFDELAYLTDPSHRAQIGPHPPEARRPIGPGRRGPGCITESVVLDGIDELERWLRRHGSSAPPRSAPELTEARSFAVFRIDPSVLPRVEGETLHAGPVGPIRLVFETDRAVCPIASPIPSNRSPRLSAYVLSDRPMVPVAGAGSAPSFALNLPPTALRDPAALAIVTDPQFGTYRRMAWPEPHLAYLALDVSYDTDFHVTRFEIPSATDPPSRDLHFEPLDPVKWWTQRLASSRDAAERLRALAVLARHDDSHRTRFDSLLEQGRRQREQEVAERAASARKLASSDDEDARLQAARSQDANVDVLRLLSEDPSPRVRSALASRRDLPPELLTRLLNDPDIPVRRTAARHRSAPASLRTQILRAHGSIADHTNLARDRATQAKTLIALSRSNETGVRRAVAVNPGTPPIALQALAADPDRKVRALVAAHPATPPAILDSLAGDPEPEVRRAVAANEATSEQTLRRLASDKDAEPAGDGRTVSWVRRHVASRARQARTLKLLATDQDTGVRARVARNARTPALLLARLVRDPSPEVRLALLSRSSLRQDQTQSLLAALAGDEDARSRITAAGHPQCSPKLLNALATDPDVRVRIAVAGNPQASAALLRRLAVDPELAVRAKVAAHPRAEDDLLRRLAQDVGTRAAVAGNAGAAPDLLAQLADDEDPRVRDAVARNPATRFETLRELSRDVHLPIAMQARQRLQTSGNSPSAQVSAAPLAGFRLSPPAVMGTQCALTAVVPAGQADRARQALRLAEEALRGVEARVSARRADTEIARLNIAGAGQRIPLSSPTVHLLRTSRDLALQTDGAFDVTCRPILNLWEMAAKQDRLPSEAELATARDQCGWRWIQLHHDAATKSKSSVGVDLGGIAKGYGIDCAIEALRSAGCRGGLVDVGGDMRCFGRKPSGERWNILVRDPFRPANPEGFCIISLSEGAVCTSGNYFRFSRIQGKRYSHIVDPRTSRPVDFAPSVTVVGTDAMIADAWATALSVLGTAGLERLASTPGLEAMIVTGEPQDYRVHMTDGFRKMLSEPPHPAPSEPRTRPIPSPDGGE
jgi:FAD:protein FMN transferase